jgi:hypothetical protein
MNIIRNNDGSYALNISASQLYQTVSKLDMAQLAKDADQSPPTPPPPVTTPTPSPAISGFQGIYAFNTGNSSALATNPSIAGTELAYYWSQLEPVQGQYNWSLIDNDMQPWIANNKKVTLRVKPAGWTAWQPPYSQKGTPQWVLDQGVKYVTDPDKAIKPQYWNINFLNSLAAFAQAFAERYDGHPNILAIEIAVGDGGETKPSTNKQTSLSAWQAIGYTDAVWWNAIQEIIQIYVHAFVKTPLVLMPDASFLGGTKGYDEALVVNYAAKYGVWLQWNGLVAGAKLPGSFAGLKVPVICEQLNVAGANKRPLAGDLQTALDLGAVAALIFTSDLQDSANAATLAKFAGMVK